MATLDHTIENGFGEIFHKSLVTNQFIFFTNDGDGILMFYVKDPERKPLGGYGAEELLIRVILKKDWIWASKDMKYNIKCILEDNLDWDYP
ncbi:hypothetical protein EZ456_04225 [Pedobacter psychrodurus]|uniref:Uncharacterized protein n=1 Tax=Pedobacter psychrodurus TaxID=2530456 RepID=A0A4R0PZC1_9SPHI|nr:hypothetical protein [Pedobacter psychrodurus]TCD28602.1 hypothetical protein EZ456_04225 [Pedobacter psychrodurus]